VKDWESALAGALQRRKILESTGTNVRQWRSVPSLPQWAADAIDWLLDRSQWAELDSRFHRSLELGTAGMRGRVIGAVAAPGEVAADGQPAHAAIGSATMNDFCVVRATIALHRRWEKYSGPFRLAIAHDVRHFSQHFARITAAVWQLLGGEAFSFAGPRSTPQLSFAVRQLGAAAGVVITASHNPRWDNGYKIYDRSGAQVVDPDATAIMDSFNGIGVGEICRTLAALPEDGTAGTVISEEMDTLYTRRLMASAIDPTALRHFGRPAIFTPLHGTGGVIGEPLLGAMGIPYVTVACQRHFDPNFSTVRSPNPEDRDALTHALELADELGSDLALAVDPDGDRLAVSLRGGDGRMHTLSGNEMAVFLLAYRLEALKRTGILTEETATHAVVIRSLVTTPLLDRIAADHGVRTVTTPIGFKWIGGRLRFYEEKLMESLAGRWQGRYIDLEEGERRQLALQWGSYLVLGAEESCGCMALDITRDKDAHSAMVMVCEAVASLRRSGQTWEDLFATVYRRHGYHGERLHTAVLDGARGERRMRNFLRSLEGDPPLAFDTFSVVQRMNFAADTIVDADGQCVPHCPLHIFELSGGYRLAIRASGTEPKIKFYLFAREDGIDCARARSHVAANFDVLENAVENMLATRAGR
jgi:phosphoglucomutase